MDAFLTHDVFIRLAWAQFSPHQQSLTATKELSMLKKDITSLITTTKLNTHTLVHTLFYLHQLTTSSSSSSTLPDSLTSFITYQRTTQELYELLIVLMMIANKANDDSSYTLKTWDNLTPLSTPMLKRRELLILKSIHYNVFLKEGSYQEFCSKLHNQAFSNGFILDVFSPPHSQQLQPVILTMPSLGPSSNPSPLFFDNNYPLTPRSPLIEPYMLAPTVLPLAPLTQLVPVPPPPPSSQRIYYNTPSSSTNINMGPTTTASSLKREHDFVEGPTYHQEAPMTKRTRLSSYQHNYTPQTLNIPTMPLRLLEQYQPLTPSKKNSEGVVNHDNCSCCCLTNMTNVYHNSLKVSKL